MNNEELNIEIIELLHKGQTLKAVNLYSEQKGISFKEARAYIESLEDILNGKKDKKTVTFTTRSKSTNRSKVKNTDGYPSTDKTKFWKKILIIFIVVNVVLYPLIMIGVGIINSLESMESMFGYTEWEMDILRASVANKLHLIPLILATDLVLLFYLIHKSAGQKINPKKCVTFISVLAVISISLSYWIKIDKNQFKYPKKVEAIFDDLQNKRVFKGTTIDINYLGFHIGNVDRQSSIYIVGEFNNAHYTYRPYKMFSNWKKDNHQRSSRDNGYIELDEINIETIIPKIIETTENLIKEERLFKKYKGINIIQLLTLYVDDTEDWRWRVSVRVRGNTITASDNIIFDLDGNIIKNELTPY